MTLTVGRIKLNIEAMNDAIRIAIEKGGYKRTGFPDDVLERFALNNPPYILMDADFWQALGKALGWENCKFPLCSKTHWKEHAHEYFDLVLTGGDTEQFFKDLINKQ